MTGKNAIVIGLLFVSACASLSPRSPRFVVIYDQRNATCWIQVVKDTRSPACFVAFKCGRQPVQVVAADSEVCVP